MDLLKGFLNAVYAIAVQIATDLTSYENLSVDERTLVNVVSNYIGFSTDRTSASDYNEMVRRLQLRPDLFVETEGWESSIDGECNAPSEVPRLTEGLIVQVQQNVVLSQEVHSCVIALADDVANGISGHIDTGVHSILAIFYAENYRCRKTEDVILHKFKRNWNGSLNCSIVYARVYGCTTKRRVIASRSWRYEYEVDFKLTTFTINSEAAQREIYMSGGQRLQL
ncbi:hypothetical protein HK097_010259 [Rhizophlyctis rosea]|uniref:Uncharacterized protein n=1 Tax=Rhizophlyctis rosea TaxID=64517 RepID=A0AAD5X0K4_9FUNG|nr:hypothetical protein HK097_010259 [Rhizophlyctis rosea]